MCGHPRGRGGVLAIGRGAALQMVCERAQLRGYFRAELESREPLPIGADFGTSGGGKIGMGHSVACPFAWSDGRERGGIHRDQKKKIGRICRRKMKCEKCAVNTPDPAPSNRANARTPRICPV